MSVQSVDNRWIEDGITQSGIKPILNNAFRTLTTGGPGYCNENMDKVTTLPGQGINATQIILDKTPYGPANCDQYATLIKPGVNPLTLRGKSAPGVNNPVNDSPICLESCDYMGPFGPMHGACGDGSGITNCLRTTTYCVGNQCKNNAPGGLADWMGRPKTEQNTGTWGSAINNQLSGGKEGTNNYFNPIRIDSPDQMKFGFVTQGCECQDGTSRIAGGTFYDWAQVGPGSGPHTLNTDSYISSEVWNGEGTCNTWQNFNPTDVRQSTCNLDIIKYAQTCAWCKSAVLTIPGVQPDEKFPPKLITDNRDIFGVGNVTVSDTFCTFRKDGSGKYSLDNGDCLGFGGNGKPRIPCNHPMIDNYDCPVTTPSKQKIGLLCNVPAADRLTGASCAFAQPQDINYMTVSTGNRMNNYWISYTNGPFSVNMVGDLNTQRTGNNDNYTGVITGGKGIIITFPDGTLASELMRLLKTNSTLTSQIDISLSLAEGASLSNPQNSIPPPISVTFNTAVLSSNKSINIGNITYLYRSSDYDGYSGSYFDGNIQIQYVNGPLGMTISGKWYRIWITDQEPNIIQISFPNNYDGPSLVNYINQQFQASSNTKVHNLIASGGSGPQMSYHSTYYYGFGQGSDPKSGGTWYPGNCNVHLDGTIFTGEWMKNVTYKDPTSGTTEPWIGKDGIKCDYDPNQGSCQTMFYNPAKTGDCQICDSEFWDWIPGGVEAVLDPSNTLHNLAITAYIPKFQELKNVSTCTQPISGAGSTLNSVSFCGKDNGNNRCTAVCGQGCVKMSWDTKLADSATVVDNLVPDTGGINNFIPSQDCPNTMCERNPVLTLRGTSEEENNKLVTNWMNGIFDLSELHGRSTGIQNTTTPDLRAYGKPEELHKRTIKAMRCCLGVDPGFQSSDGGPRGGPKTEPNKDPYGGLEMWDLHDCPPGVMCPSSDTCKELYKSVLDGSNEHVQMNLNDFGAASYPTGFSLDKNATSNTPEDTLLNPAYYTKAYCEMMSGGSTKTMSTIMGLDDEINTLCRKAMYNYCITPVEVDVIDDANYWNAPIGATTAPKKNENYSKTTYELPLKIFTQGCNMWFKNNLQEVMPSDYGTRDMLLGSACQRLQVDGWFNPVGPDQSPLLQAFVTKDGKIKDNSGYVYDLSYVGSASATSGAGSIPDLLAKTCNCFLLGSKCQGSSGSNCSYQYCGAGIEDPLTIDFGHEKGIIDPLNKPVDLTPYTSKLGSDGTALGDSSWTKYQDIIAPSWSTGLDPKTFTCAKGSAPQGMAIAGDEAGGSSNCFTGCNFVNEYDVCWNASPENRKYSGELLGGTTKWSCDFSEKFSNTCDPSKGDSYSCFGECEHDNTKKDGSQFPSCGTQTWFDSNLSLNPGEIKAKQNRSPGRSGVMDTPYWQNFYSGASEQVSSAKIPNIGSVYNPSRSMLASDSICGSADSVKPYNLQFTSQNQCIISQGVSVNNQGSITGSVGISQLGSCNTSNIFQGHNQYDFLTYMGGIDCTGKDQTCWNTNSFCLTDGSTITTDGIPAGENCMACGNSTTSLIDAPNKPNTCCLDPSLANGDKTYETANASILNKVTLGDTPVVSYFCSAGTCPIGSTDLATLQTTCGSDFTCKGATDQESCEGCDYCKWQPIYTSGPGGVPIDTGNKQCIASCPTAPQNGWVSGGITPKPTPTPTDTPTLSPTPGPTVKPTTAPNTGGVGAITNLSSTDITLIVIGVIIFIAFAINGVFVWNQKRKPNGFGKVKRRGVAFGKRI